MFIEYFFYMPGIVLLLEFLHLALTVFYEVSTVFIPGLPLALKRSK